MVPTRLEIFGIEVRLALLPDGSLAVSAGNGKQQNLLVSSLTAAMETPGRIRASGAGTAAAAGAARPRSLAMKRIAAALRLLIDIATRPTGPLAKIDRVAISQGRFVIEDELNNETKLYDGLQLSLAKTGGGTNFDLSAQGPERSVVGLRARRRKARRGETARFQFQEHFRSTRFRSSAGLAMSARISICRSRAI